MMIKIKTLCLFVFVVGITKAQTTKLTITPLTKNFYVFTTYGDLGNGNLYPSNSLYVVTNKGVVLLDTPWDSTQFKPLLDTIEAKHHLSVILCIATHFHADKTAGLEYYKQKSIATYTTKQTDSLSKLHNQKRAEHLITKDTVFNFGEYSFQTYYPGKGHSPDNIVIWFPKQKVLHGGCFIKSTEANDVGNLSDADTKAWANSIKKVQQQFSNAQFIITGHLSWVDVHSLQHTVDLVKAYNKTHQ